MAMAVADYHEQLRRLRPDFDDCPEPCAETNRDVKDFCAGCEVAAQWREFKDGFHAEIKRRELGLGVWSFTTLYRDVIEVMSTNARTRRNTLPRGCSALQAACLGIVRNEIYRPLRVARWEQQQRIERGRE